MSLNAQYTFPFDPGKLVLSASVIWKDKTYGSIFNNPQALAASYSTVNLRAEWDDAKNRYNVSAFVNNVFNTTGYDIVTEAQIAPDAALGATHYNIIRAVEPDLPADLRRGVAGSLPLAQTNTTIGAGRRRPALSLCIRPEW